MSTSPNKEYDNGEVVITWQPEKCTHSGNCVRGLPRVFNPRKKPWIEIGNASSEELVNQVKKCPSGALGYYFKNKEDT
ncbi:(4Fe-4S)-binding protein [Algoriphagus sp. A40]|uniref:(4Fe-4S)-binding protein n=1 Tax=Algoriphagus sp. A40 TaxID=1945863 RepID=UPI000985D9B8|nr:(4Fe-4S)-binding protein [Algoriphagus sp. A40]OOG74948.1 (4Fe-4S)-binding protein [Algoriphagus sp. A40]